MSAVPVPQIHYRRMRATDLAEVAFLEKSLYAFPWSLGNFRDSLNAGYDCWTVAHGETVIGYAVLMIALDEAHLLNVAIAEEWQNQGIGVSFMRHMIEVARGGNAVPHRRCRARSRGAPGCLRWVIALAREGDAVPHRR